MAEQQEEMTVGVNSGATASSAPRPKMADKQEEMKVGADSGATGSSAPRPAEEEDSVSMLDVLEDEAQLEQDAHAVLGGSDPTHCTYPRGYVDRQALYSCITCTTVDTQPAGICLACSLECHEGHNLYELYTKRNFRCDCGDKKFVDSKCKLNPTKSDVNTENSYSQNFQGLYCVCHRPYPDLEDETDDEMIQCSVCEDWYHGRHIGVDLPEDFDELVCVTCMQKLQFLYYYTSLYPKLQGTANKTTNDLTDKEVDVTKDTKTTNDTDKSEVESIESEEKQLNQNSENQNKPTNSTGSSSSEPAKSCDEGESSKTTAAEKSETSVETGKNSGEKVIENGKSKSVDKAFEVEKSGICDVQKTADEMKETLPAVIPNVSTTQDAEVTECKLKQLENCCPNLKTDSAMFWPEGWRSKLCTCVQCKKLYDNLGVTFLTRSEDTIKAYEARGKDSATPSQYEKGMRALQNMDRVQQVEVLTEYNSMKDELTDYLKKFADNKKMVREEDIREFFQDLSKRKRPRNEMSHFCK